MAGARSKFAFLLCALCAASSIVAADQPEILFNSPESIILSAGDTLEFTIRAPARPEAKVWALAPGQAEPAADAVPQARSLIFPSPKPGEYLVQVRGLSSQTSAADLLVRWSYSYDGKVELGQQRFAKRAAFRSDSLDVVVLMDGSKSMEDNDPQRLRVAAAAEFIGTARNSNSIGRIAIVQFDSKSRTLIELTPPSGDFKKALLSLDERGETDIDGGIRHALGVLQSGELTAGGAIILLTDGRQEPGHYRDAHELARKAGIAVHALALGKSADRKLLKRIAAETNGTFADAAKDQDLAAAYSAIASNLTRTRTVLSERLGAAKSFNVPIDFSSKAVRVEVSEKIAGTLAVTDPGGSRWTGSPALAAIFTTDQPPPGEWKVDWSGNDGAAAQLRVSARTSLYPALFRKSESADKMVVELDSDDPHIGVSLFDAADAISGAKVEVYFGSGGVSAPTKNNPLVGAGTPPPPAVLLFDDGKHNDGAANDGIYAVWLPQAEGDAYPENSRGVLRVVAAGKRGTQEFRRETENEVVFHRYGKPGLTVSADIDFGERFGGDIMSGEISLRVRGGGGKLDVRLESPPEFDNATQLEKFPPQLAPRSQTFARLNLALPKFIRPGDYSGIVHLQLERAEPAAVRWRVRVVAPKLRVAPERIELGTLHPGTSRRIAINLRTSGGFVAVKRAKLYTHSTRSRIDSFIDQKFSTAELLPELRKPLRLAAKFPPQDIGTQTFTHEFEFAALADTYAADIDATLVLWDERDRVAEIPLHARVAQTYLQADFAGNFGRGDPGDTLDLPISAELNGVKIAFAGDSKFTPTVSAKQLSLKIPAGAAEGNAGGWIMLETGAALIMRPWSAEVVHPRFAFEPQTVDFGRKLPGHVARQKLILRATSAHDLTVEVKLDGPFFKPRVPSVKLPGELLKIGGANSFSGRIQSGIPFEIPLAFEIPDAAQDGLYQSRLVVSSRLGKIEIPARMIVASVVAPAPFHVSPPRVTLNVVEGGAIPTETLRITSHDDEPLKIVLRVDDGTEGTEGTKEPRTPAAYLLTEGERQVLTQDVTVPPRATIAVQLQARPDAAQGEMSFLHLNGADEHQVVEVEINRLFAAHEKSGAVPKLLDWIIAVYVLGVLLLIFLVRALVRKQWVRYAAYAVLIHMAVLPLAMPGRIIVNALPESVEITLLESQESLGLGLTEAQAQRLDALKSGLGPENDKSGAPAKFGTLPGKEALSNVPEQGQRPALDGPKQTEIERMRGPESLGQASAPPEPSRAAGTLPDAPLSLDAEPPPPPQRADDVADNKPAAPRAAGFAAPQNSPAIPAFTPEISNNTPAPRGGFSQPERIGTIEVAEARPGPALTANRPVIDAVSDAPLFSDVPLTVATSEKAIVAADSRTKERARETPAAPQLGTREFNAGTATSDVLVNPSLRQLAADVVQSAGKSEVKSFEDSTTNQPRAFYTAPGASGSGRGYAAKIRPGGLPGGNADAPLSAGFEGGNGAGGVARATPRKSDQPGKGAGGTEGTGTGAGRTSAAYGPGLIGATGSGFNNGTGKGFSTGAAGFGAGAEELSAYGNGRSGGTANTGGMGRSEIAGIGNGFGATGATSGVSGGEGWGGTTLRRGGGFGDGDTPLPSSPFGGTGARAGGGSGTGKGAGPGVPNGTGEPGAGFGENGRRGAAGTGLLRGGDAGPGISGLRGDGTGFGIGSGGTGAGAGAPGGHARGGASAIGGGISSGALENSGNGNGGRFGNGQGTGRAGTITSPYTGALIRFSMGLAKHAGDWNSSPTALHYLRSAFVERSGLPELEVSVKTMELTNLQQLQQCRMILVTSNSPIKFTDQEFAAMREYIRGGGTLWVNDSSASDYEPFDQAFRADVAKLWPNGKLEVLPLEHPFFNACYDLRSGFKGFRIPPGDKYRQDFMEALFLPIEGLPPDPKMMRAAIIYTRNDYADGLEIDPRMNAGMKSLTDLTNGEMLESSLRFGVNLLAYSLGNQAPKFPPPPENAAEFEKIYRYKGPPLPVLDTFAVLEDANQKQIWIAEKDWCNETALKVIDDAEEKSKLLQVDCKGGGKFKSAVTRYVPTDLSKTKALVFDLHSTLKQGFNVSLLMYNKDTKAYETRVVFVRPGWNRNLRFPLDMGDMKSSATNWKNYDTAYTPRNECERISILLYNLGENGSVKIGPVRLEP